MTNLQKSSFIEPSPKPELDGELGLYASEIAASLGVPTKVVRNKMGARGFLKRLECLNMTAEAFGALNKNNGLEFTEYVLDVDAAKFFVGKWNNELGDAYMAFLIGLEKKADLIEGQAKNDPLTAQILQSLQIRSEQLKQANAIKNVEQRVGRIESRTPELVKERVDKVLNDKTAFPVECIRVEHIGPKYFPGVAREKFHSYLKAIDHPRGHYIHQGDSGAIASRPFIEEGLDLAAEKFFSERIHIKTTDKLMFWRHPLVGDMQEKRITGESREY